MVTKTPAEIVAEMTLFDDDLMSHVFDNNIEAATLLLSILLEREDIQVLSVEGQKELENPLVEGRSIRLDIFAQDADGKYYDIKVQQSSSGADFRRARFHSSMLDSRMLKQGDSFKTLADSYVIFMTRRDILGLGLPLYRIERTVSGTDLPFTDGSHILYVNGSYRGADPIGRLIHDFHCPTPENMYYAPLSKGVHHFKQTEGGQYAMCEAVREYGEEVRLQTLLETVKAAMASFNITFEQAVKAFNISEADAAVLTKNL